MYIKSIKLTDYTVDSPFTKKKETAVQNEGFVSVEQKQPTVEQDIDESIEAKEAFRKSLDQCLKSSEKQTGELDKLKVLATCLEIARRIMAGDIVPPEDHKYLMKHDMSLYLRAVSMRVPKNDPDEYKQLSKDDKQQAELQVGIIDCAENLETVLKETSFKQAVNSIVFDIKV